MSETTEASRFEVGDTVEFKGEPGWGKFVVQDVEKDSVDGAEFRRLHVCSKRSGRKMTFLEENAVKVLDATEKPLHQMRVIAERMDLEGNIERLNTFTGSDTFRSLDLAEQHRLVRQLNLQRQLSSVLAERIAAF
ncbi:hypothetical protein KBW71_03320 [Hydrogenophaga aromaticivorans]|uniref:crAss001_48 related protein n=1 Tax=Hydrogenophaga aromaticivorans TaxID=2610898 RepID=UPI001B368DE2|nr:hypothetical protein [Hydrogenophaga aromaticivorans]MBQ0917459.1 hypothetical protein [Hydrogenophaga aromaticivorans]